MRRRVHSVSKDPFILLALVLVVSLAGGTAYSQPFPGKGSAKFLTEDHRRFRAAVRAQTKNMERLMGILGVVGSGVGVGPEGVPEIKVFTARAGIQGIPSALDGVPVKEKVTGRFYALVDTTARFRRPVPLGVSTGHPAITAGTIGARVKDSAGNVYALSNNHVYAAVNSANIGDPVLQPGAYDGGRAGPNPAIIDGDEIGTLYNYEPIKMCTWGWSRYTCRQTNTLDAAIARSSTALLENTTPESLDPDATYTPSEETVEPFVGQEVKKYGRTTELTYGTVDAVNVTVDICYDDACYDLARFTDQISITPGSFSSGGDSGSLIVSQEGNHPVGLLFAGSATSTLANRISTVLSRFGVTIDGTPAPAVTDVAIASVSAPATVLQGSVANVDVTVQNLGNQDVTDSFTVALRDVTDAAEIQEQVVSGLASGTSTALHFSWDTTGSELGSHTLEASHTLSDDNHGNDAATTGVQVTASVTDVAVTRVDAPASLVQGDVGEVTVTVGNVGNQNVEDDFDVSLRDLTDNVAIGTVTLSGLAGGASQQVAFSWNTEGRSLGVHSLEAGLTLSSDQIPENNSKTTTVGVTGVITGPHIQFGKVVAETDYPTRVTLDYDYGDEMVVICTVNYDKYSVPMPVVPHVLNNYGNSFDIVLVRAVGWGFEPCAAEVHWMAVKQGAYTVAAHGIKMEAGQIQSTRTDGAGSWVAERISPVQTYSHPVVLGQVMSLNSYDPPSDFDLWSVFWARGSSHASPPKGTDIWIGKHAGEDYRQRAAETVGYVVIEAGRGVAGFGKYLAGVTSDLIRGVGDRPPYKYTLTGISTPANAIAILSSAGMDGRDGGWPILYGARPISTRGLNLAVDEDQAMDYERRHATEQAAYLVLEK
jgi:hypothetical protein